MVKGEEGKNKWDCKQLTKLEKTKVLQGTPHAAMFVVSFANFKSRTLACNPLGDACRWSLKILVLWAT